MAPRETWRRFDFVDSRLRGNDEGLWLVMAPRENQRRFDFVDSRLRGNDEGFRGREGWL